jgi:hypothetical protein
MSSKKTDTETANILTSESLLVSDVTDYFRKVIPTSVTSPPESTTSRTHGGLFSHSDKK